jgi:hypothetical protein
MHQLHPRIWYYTAQAKIVTRLTDDHADGGSTCSGVPKSSGERTSRKVEQGARVDPLRGRGWDWSGFPPVRARPVSPARTDSHT